MITKKKATRRITVTRVAEKSNFVKEPEMNVAVQPDGFIPNEDQRRYVEAIAIHGCTCVQARKRTKTRLPKVRDWMLDSRFRRYLDSELKIATGEQVGLVRQALAEKAKDGDVSAIKLYLETFDPEFKKAAKDKKGSDTYVMLLQQIGVR